MANKVSLDATAISEKWARRTKAAVSDAQAGIMRVTESPAQKAVAKAQKMKQNLIASIDNGTWAKRLGGVSLEEWKTKTAQKVGERLSGGVDGAASKRAKFDGWLVGRLNEVLPKIEAMPDMTLEDSVNRVRTLMEHMSKSPFRKTG